MLKNRIIIAILSVFFITVNIGAEVNVNTKIGLRLNVSIDVGANFDGWDAKESMGAIAGLYFYPYKEIKLTNTLASDYEQTLKTTGITGFRTPSMTALNPVYMLSLVSEIIKDSMELQESLNNERITEENYEKRMVSKTRER